jgi:hypothetical protein
MPRVPGRLAGRAPRGGQGGYGRRTFAVYRERRLAKVSAMKRDKAIVRQHVEKIEGVSRTWIEWSYEEGHMVKTLVVEITADTDPNCPDFEKGLIDAIEETARDVLERETPMIVSHLRIVPRLQMSG